MSVEPSLYFGHKTFSIIGALKEAIRSREEKEDYILPELDNSPSKKSFQGHSPSKLGGKGVRWVNRAYESDLVERFFSYYICRRRKVKEEESRAFHHTVVMKLFDRSVDLAQFRSLFNISDNNFTPLPLRNDIFPDPAICQYSLLVQI
jgi:hypothetical protein